MKKFALFLVLVMLLSLLGCDLAAPTLCIPTSYQTLDADGQVQAAFNFIFEEGWQDKDTFTITYSDPRQGTVTVSDKCMIHQVDGGPTTELYFDDQGRVIREVSIYPYDDTEDLVTLYTYDQHGRLLTETQDDLVITYTYTDTETGSQGICQLDGTRYELHYDSRYRLTTQIEHFVDMEGLDVPNLRIETVYHEDGSISQLCYIVGRLSTERRVFYTQQKVSAETVARLPWFQQPLIAIH